MNLCFRFGDCSKKPLTSNSYRLLGQTLSSLVAAFTFLAKSALASSVCIVNQAPEPPTFTPQEFQSFLGLIPEIQSNPLSLYIGYWTNWYSEPTLEGSLAKLSVQCGILDLSNLIPTYPPDKLTGNLQPGELICDDATYKAALPPVTPHANPATQDSPHLPKLRHPLVGRLPGLWLRYSHCQSTAQLLRRPPQARRPRPSSFRRSRLWRCGLPL